MGLGELWLSREYLCFLFSLPFYAGTATVPTPTPTAAPSANNKQALVSAVISMPASMTPADFTAYLQDAFKGAVLLSMSGVWPGMTADHVYVSQPNSVESTPEDGTGTTCDAVFPVVSRRNASIRSAFEVPW